MRTPRQSSVTARVILAVLAGYRRWISPMFGAHCRFHPSCSAYAVTAVTEHGALRGSWLTLRRLAKCQPFFPGGYDPVPTRQPARPSRRHRRVRLPGAAR